MRKPTKQQPQQGIGTPRPGQQNPVRERAQQPIPVTQGWTSLNGTGGDPQQPMTNQQTWDQFGQAPTGWENYGQPQQPVRQGWTSLQGTGGDPQQPITPAGQSEFNAAQAQYDRQRRVVGQQPFFNTAPQFGPPPIPPKVAEPVSIRPDYAQPTRPQVLSGRGRFTSNAGQAPPAPQSQMPQQAKALMPGEVQRVDPGIGVPRLGQQMQLRQPAQYGLPKLPKLPNLPGQRR